MRADAEVFAAVGKLTSSPVADVDGNSIASHSHHRVLLAERACAERHPPVLHQASILQQFGQVTLLDAPGRQDDPAVQTSARVRRIRISASDNSVKGLAMANMRWAYRYFREFGRQIAESPDVVVAYEPDAAAQLLQSRARSGGPMRIVHLHETPDKALYGGSGISRIAVRLMLARLNRADAVILPDADRAAYAVEVAKLSRPPMVVMNCPPVLATLPESKLLTWLSERGITSQRVVHFQGAIGAERGLTKIIESMRYWPTDSVFVIVGDGSPTVLEQLHTLIAREGVASRVFFVGRVPYADVFSYAVGATLGITLVEPLDRNTQLCAGASNKRFEYAALGIPQITNSGPGMRRLFEAPGIATLVDVADVHMLGQAIAQILGNASLASSIGARARSLHLSLYNYEAQFAPVVDRIRVWMSGRMVVKA